MNKKVPLDQNQLSRREREALDAVHQLKQASVAEVQALLTGNPSYPATRMVLQRLHKKSLLQADRDGKRYVYRSAVPSDAAGVSALRATLSTFFQGSTSKAVSALLGSDQNISAKELEELEALVRAAREEKQ